MIGLRLHENKISLLMNLQRFNILFLIIHLVNKILLFKESFLFDLKNKFNVHQF